MLHDIDNAKESYASRVTTRLEISRPTALNETATEMRPSVDSVVIDMGAQSSIITLSDNVCRDVIILIFSALLQIQYPVLQSSRSK